VLSAWSGAGCDGVIRFTVAQASFKLSAAYTFTSCKLLLDASGLSGGVTLRAAPSERHITMSGASGNLTAKAVTFRDGDFNLTTPSSYAYGGSLRINNAAHGLFEDCTFINNTVHGVAGGGGGAISGSISGYLRLGVFSGRTRRSHPRIR
jgi:hypothetical protein